MAGPRSFEHEHIPTETLRRLEECERRIGYTFQDPNYLHQALTHSSIKTVDKPCNERMEFLGDSVLGLVMTEFLFNYHEHLSEGDLTQIKSVVVSTTALATESERLELDAAFQVGKGVTSKKQLPASLLANVFEAVVCAIYMDGGLHPARAFILRNLYHQVLAVNENRHSLNYKSMLQQHLQKTDGKTPTYKVVGESGPDHAKTFKVQASIGKKQLGQGKGMNKKEAEQAAALESLEKLGLCDSEGNPLQNGNGNGNGKN
ncbi:MAG: ribonuclease III [Planctomycetota bacterium]